MRVYNRNEWKEFRDGVIELDGNKCSNCDRSDKEVVLQVHHKKYIPGRLPWEYATEHCITLCKGCHAREHGLIQPNHGWEYMADYDLGDLIGVCENCGTFIRYYFIIFHQNWGTLEVGKLCCINLIDKETVNNDIESKLKYNGRLKRFISSNKWIEEDNVSKIRILDFDIKIHFFSGLYSIEVNKLKSKIVYDSIIEAKTKLFTISQNGKLEEYFRSNFLFKAKKGHIISSNKMQHLILYLKKINEFEFFGWIFSQTPPEEYLMKLKFNNVENSEYDFELTDFYLIKSGIIDLEVSRPFKIIGKLDYKTIRETETWIRNRYHGF